MPPAVDRSPSSLPSPLSGRRLLSRITQPFRPKSRFSSDFYIEVDDPHKQYSPGEAVTGSVRLRVAKPVRVTHIAVCLHGFVQAHKHPGSLGEGFRANNGYPGTGRGKKAGEYFGNGFASLFEDEVVLCGDGRLAEGSYQFNFELVFPDNDLPSSIDFERGTITYMITATLTRPTTISPIITCDRKVYFVESIDISQLYPPPPRRITLEAISRRSRAKYQARKLVDPTDRRSRKSDSAQQSDQTRASGTSSTPSAQAEGDTPGSPVPSEISFESLMSSGRRTSQPDSSQPLSGALDPSRSNASKTSLGNKTITVTVESQTGGCLRGDYVEVKVNVNHTKSIRSLYGVILTLYRQARVDMHPAIPIGPTEKGVSSHYDDYYPKSITGLGGLSLSGAGSSHVFRKDLAQVMVPFYVDPVNLTAEVTAKVRVPEDAFPTISTVPGAMISFKYYAEVVLDIQGKLGGADRNAINLAGAAAESQSHALGVESVEHNAAFAPLGSNIVDTTPIRRDKGVVTCTFEVIVGTRGSTRKGKRKMEADPELEPRSIRDAATAQPHGPATASPYQAQHVPGTYSDDAGDPAYWYGDGHAYDESTWQQPYYYDHYDYHDPAQPEPPPPVPVPPLPDESHMSEKERLQRAEAHLLPSQPPETDGPEASAAARAAPSAPYLPDDVPLEADGPAHPQAPSYGEITDAGGPATPRQRPDADHRDPLAPDYAVAEATGSAPSRSAILPADDKQELERRRLEAEASAPQADEDRETATSHATAPSVPRADEADDAHGGDSFDSHADAAGSSGLPRYER